MKFFPQCQSRKNHGFYFQRPILPIGPLTPFPVSSCGTPGRLYTPRHVHRQQCRRNLKENTREISFFLDPSETFKTKQQTKHQQEITMKVGKLIIPMDVYPLITVVSIGCVFGAYTTVASYRSAPDVVFNKTKYGNRPPFLSKPEHVEKH